MMMKTWLSLMGLASLASGFGTLCGSDSSNLNVTLEVRSTMPPNYKVAFIGDAGSGYQQKEVLTMIKNWGGDLVIHSGDFEYQDDAARFERQINEVLGRDFPYFGSIGNHDVGAWTGASGHQSRLVERMRRFGADSSCTGDYGVNMVCDWNGFLFILSGAGTRGSGHSQYIDRVFSNNAGVWKFVSWHKNQRLMQIGGKSDETGWGVYDTTRKHGAMVVTGHEHSYCRSFLMKDFRRQSIVSKNNDMNLSPGRSFVFVSGLAGMSIRSWNTNLKNKPWWASVAASNNGVSDGALLCTFNVNGNLRQAKCEFKDRKGKVWDSFNIYSRNAATLEEHRRLLAEEEAQKPLSCESKWIEVPITSSAADHAEGASPSASILELGKGIVSLRFDAVPLLRGAKIQHAYLQVYGASEENGERGDYRFRGSEIVWETDDEDFERHTVWVSPDLKELVQERISGEDWTAGSAIVLELEGKVRKAFYSFDESPCLAPTLAIELEADC